MMNDGEFAFKTLWDDCYQVARVNILTGSFRFVKTMDEAAGKPFYHEPTIGDYMRKTVEAGLIHPDDRKLYLELADKDSFARLFTRVDHKLTANFRGMYRNGIVWITLEILLPESFSPIEPEVLFCWRKSDTAYCVLQEAMQLLRHYFYKILKINLTSDSYEIMKVNAHELSEDQGLDPTFSGWLRGFMEHGGMAKEDWEDVRRSASVETLRAAFRVSQEPVMCRYRRLINGSYRWVSMEIVPTPEYSENCQIVMLFIHDIHTSHMAELNYRKSLEYAYNYDALTNVKNRHCYDELRNRLTRRPLDQDTGVLLASLRNLHWRAEHLGSAAADAYIQSFAKILAEQFDRSMCYRPSKGSFAVVLEDVSQEALMNQKEQLLHLIRCDGRPMASVGYAWQPQGGSMEALVQEAEQCLAADHEPGWL